MRKLVKTPARLGLLLICLCPQATLAIDKDQDGYYLLRSTADYNEFCEMVNGGSPFVNARVTTDSIVVKNSIGVGDEEFHFRGLFDGQNHVLTLDNPTRGLFRQTQPGCVIRNVILKGTVTSDKADTGSLIDIAEGTIIENCTSQTTINAQQATHAGGLVGRSRGDVVLNHCHFDGQIRGGATTQVAGLVGWNEHTLHLRHCSVTGANKIANNLDNNSNFVDDINLNGSPAGISIPASLADNAPAGATKVTLEGVNYSIENGYAYVTGVNAKLKSVSIPNQITVGNRTYPTYKIRKKALSNATLQYASIPASVVSIEDDAFHDATQLSELHLADGASKLWIGRSIYTFLDEEMFYKSPLTRVYIGRNLAWNGSGINDEPFEDRNNISSITFGPRVTAVGNVDDPGCFNSELFNDCRNIKRYAFLGDEQSLGTSVRFHCCEGMSAASKAYINRDLEASKYTEFTVLANGWGISDQLSSVAYGPFATYVTTKMYSGVGATTNNKLQELDLSHAMRLTTIQSRAFADCDQLTAVDFSRTKLQSIDTEAFYDCDKLASINFGETVGTIGARAFDDTGITNIQLPASLTQLGSQAFHDCDEAVSLVVAPGENSLTMGMESGDSQQFGDCANLATLYLGRNMQWNNPQAANSPFAGSNLKQIVIDDAVTHLPDYAFVNQKSLFSISVGANISSIPTNCFEGTEEVASLILSDTNRPITLGASVAPFKVQSLYVGRPVADYVNMPRGLTDGAPSLKHAQFGQEVHTLTTGALKDYPKLHTAILPANVTLEPCAIENCGVEHLYVQGNAELRSEAIKNCNRISELTVVGKLTMEERALASAPEAPAIKNINVFFSEDPQDESHPLSFPQKCLDESVLNNLYDTPYQKVDFSHLPWSAFAHRNTFLAHDYSPTSEVMENGNYDHAYLRSEHKSGEMFGLLMPFDVSSYYFGADATAYALTDGCQLTTQEDTVTLCATTPEALDAMLHFKTNVPYLICSPHSETMVQAAIDQFRRKDVEVNYTPTDASTALPYFCSNKDELLTPEMGQLYVFEAGCLKKVNGAYTLPAFSLALRADGSKRLHIADKHTGERLVPDETVVVPHEGLKGCCTFYSNESSFLVEGAQVYTVSLAQTEDGQDALQLVEVEDRTVSQGQAVLLITDQTVPLHLQMVTHPSTHTSAYENNLLVGVNHDTPVEELDHALVLSLSGGAVGFFPPQTALGEAQPASLPANHAFLSTQMLSPDTLPLIIVEGQATRVATPHRGEGAQPSFDLYGRRISQPQPRQLIIQNQRKHIKR
ncbi:MAG: leucine-rich repeat protein [Bacteroidales bacterium]|nr:leucine-rich repeat protein [Candidatus Physcousia equi]